MTDDTGDRHDTDDHDDHDDIDEHDVDDVDDDSADQALREQLGALDPAATLRPADPAQVTRLLAATVRDDLDSDIPETRQTGVHERSRLTWLVAAAAVLLIAGVGMFVLLDQGADDPPEAAPSGPTASVDPVDPEQSPGEPTSVTTLGVPPTPDSARCAVPSADVLSRQSLAFDGVVETVSGDDVTIAPTVFYAGEPTDRVQVEAPPEVLRELLLAVDFQVGQRYLISALDGRVSVCGYSGAWSPGLEQLYLEAFPG